jgi:hypothetical protein
MDALTMRSRLLLPGSDRALVKAEREDDGLRRTAVSEQGQNPRHGFLVGFEPMEHAAFVSGEGFAAGSAFPAVFEAIVQANVVLIGFAS